MESYEQLLLMKQEVFVFKIPARTSIKSYRAADWNLSVPDWVGRMRLVAKGSACTLYLEDKVSGELYAKCPIESYPGVAVEPVSDSSRFFVIRIQDDSGRTAFIGFGFTDRADSFDFNVALQDHFKLVKKTEEIDKEQQEPREELDLRFKEGETIKINMKIAKKEGMEGAAKKKSSKTQIGGNPLQLSGATGDFIKILPPPTPSKSSLPQQPSPSNAAAVGWDEFKSATDKPADDAAPAAANPNWVQF